jgi:VIT1/CCC1 family predicted Fe2+/Mn2+ transporter
MLSRSLDKARAAYASKDPEATRRAHEPQARTSATEEHRNEQGRYMKSLVYGGLDGVITTFAVVAGVEGASLAPTVLLILGAANLLADGLSMSIGDYLSTRAEQEYSRAERRREEWEIEHYPEGEKQELVELYIAKGMSEDDAREVVERIARYPKTWADVMMLEELGILEDNESPLKSALATFFAFAVLGSVPLLTPIAALFWPRLSSVAFPVSSILTAAALFVLGALKTRLTLRTWWRSGFEMLLVGGIAAAAAYGVGVLLSGLQ